tara:strand:+ start:1191 stop:1556 length:366 start_codon:yes stop_codon:yes gene_type:complete
MKKILFMLLIISGCTKDDYSEFTTNNSNSLGNLVITDVTGLKFEGSNITDKSKFNLKVLEAGEYTIEVRDYFKNLTSKSIIDAQSGDNVFKFYTRALQDGDYTIIIGKDGSELHNVKLVIK